MANFNAVFRSQDPPPTPVVTRPVVSNVSPTPGTAIGTTQPVMFDVTCGVAMVRVLVAIRFEGMGLTELVHDGEEFAPAYVGSSRAAIASGFRYTLLRTPLWPDAPKLIPFAYSNDGGENL